MRTQAASHPSTSFTRYPTASCLMDSSSTSKDSVAPGGISPRPCGGTGGNAGAAAAMLGTSPEHAEFLLSGSPRTAASGKCVVAPRPCPTPPPHLVAVGQVGRHQQLAAAAHAHAPHTQVQAPDAGAARARLGPHIEPERSSTCERKKESDTPWALAEDTETQAPSAPVMADAGWLVGPTCDSHSLPVGAGIEEGAAGMGRRGQSAGAGAGARGCVRRCCMVAWKKHWPFMLTSPPGGGEGDSLPLGVKLRRQRSRRQRASASWQARGASSAEPSGLLTLPCAAGLRHALSSPQCAMPARARRATQHTAQQQQQGRASRAPPRACPALPWPPCPQPRRRSWKEGGQGGGGGERRGEGMGRPSLPPGERTCTHRRPVPKQRPALPRCPASGAPHHSTTRHALAALGAVCVVFLWDGLLALVGQVLHASRGVEAVGGMRRAGRPGPGVDISPAALVGGTVGELVCWGTVCRCSTWDAEPRGTLRHAVPTNLFEAGQGSRRPLARRSSGRQHRRAQQQLPPRGRSAAGIVCRRTGPGCRLRQRSAVSSSKPACTSASRTWLAAAANRRRPPVWAGRRRCRRGEGGGAPASAQVLEHLLRHAVRPGVGPPAYPLQAPLAAKSRRDHTR